MGTEQIFKIVRFKIPNTGLELALNIDTVGFTFLLICIVLLLGAFFKNRVKIAPGKFQILFEDSINYFRDILVESLGEEGAKFLPFISGLFIFVLFSNWFNLVPGFKPPTKDLNTTLGLALLVFLVAHWNGIRSRGWKNYLGGYFQPYWFMFPSNLFSEFGRTLSHAFRLYGNIFAGGMIIAVIPEILVKLMSWLGVPLGIVIMTIANFFFGLFIGAIQAFVFAMLAVAYITILAK